MVPVLESKFVLRRHELKTSFASEWLGGPEHRFWGFFVWLFVFFVWFFVWLFQSALSPSESACPACCEVEPAEASIICELCLWESVIMRVNAEIV